MKRKRICQNIIPGLAVLFLCLSPVRGFAAQEEAAFASRPDFLKAATYASDAWVINFWNTESDRMDEELAQIAADGFNGIILVVPWREFQPGVHPVSYSSYAFDKLNRVFTAALRQGLWVELRLCYTWDFYAEEDAAARFRKLLSDPGTRSAWHSYMERVLETASGYPNFYGAFLTWEDFWNYVETPPVTGDSLESRREAERIGYQDYLRDYYSLDEISGYYGREEAFQDYGDIYVPDRQEPAYKLFYEFYDEFLVELLREGQQIFPELSMEVRLDIDPVNGRNGGLVGAHHFRTFPCGSAPYTSLMYSVAMGQENRGEKISAAQALATMREQLNLVRTYNGGKPVLIDQLLYVDATEAFLHNAQLYEQERNGFLVGAAPILREYAGGYAVWSYRNYANNPVYNGQFALGDCGWETRGSARAREHGGSMRMQLDRGGSISQQIGDRIDGKGTHRNRVRFTAESDGPVRVTVTLGNVKKEVPVQDSGEYELDFGSLNYGTVSFQADGTVYLDNICVYNFVQDGQLYDLDGEELGCISGIRALNAALP